MDEKINVEPVVEPIVEPVVVSPLNNKKVEVK